MDSSDRKTVSDPDANLMYRQNSTSTLGTKLPILHFLKALPRSWQVFIFLRSKEITMGAESYYQGIVSFTSLPDDDTLELASQMYSDRGRKLLFGAAEYEKDGVICMPAWLAAGTSSRAPRRGERSPEPDKTEPTDENIEDLGALFACDSLFESFAPSVNDPEGLRIAAYLRSNPNSRMERSPSAARLKVAKPLPSLKDLEGLACCKGFLDGFAELAVELKSDEASKPNAALVCGEGVSPEPFVELLYRLYAEERVTKMSSSIRTDSMSLSQIQDLPMFVEIEVSRNPMRPIFEPNFSWPKLAEISASCVFKLSADLYQGLRSRWAGSSNPFDSGRVKVIETGDASQEFLSDLPRLYELLGMAVPYLPAIEKPAEESDPFAELDALIGLDSVKTQVHEYAALLKRRGRDALPCLHMALLGNPGSGKTTVARIIADIFDKININQKRGVFIETDSGGLIAQYVGHTALKTKAVVGRAQGGVLFVDEAYALYKGQDGGGSFAAEALATLVKEMEDKRDKFICIMAGYTKETEEMLSSNPGLRDRIAFTIDFPDYSVDELLQIFDKFAKENQYTVHAGAKKLLLDYFARVVAQKDEHFSNGRIVRKIFERVRIKQALRTDSNVITKGDIQAATAEGDLAKIAVSVPKTAMGFVVS